MNNNNKRHQSNCSKAVFLFDNFSKIRQQIVSQLTGGIYSGSSSAKSFEQRAIFDFREQVSTETNTNTFSYCKILFGVFFFFGKHSTQTQQQQQKKRLIWGQLI